MLRRNASEPTCASIANSKETKLKKISAWDLRDNTVGTVDNWNEAKRKFACALAHDRELSRETERENMHFYFSELLISAVEEAAWNREIAELEMKNKTFADLSLRCDKDKQSPFNALESMKRKPPTEDFDTDEFSAGSSTFYTSVSQQNCSDNNSSSAVNEDKDMVIANQLSNSSAEATAFSLIKLLSNSELLQYTKTSNWLQCSVDSAQSLLHLPEELASFSEEVDADGHHIRLRGSAEWAPPRRQWIFILDTTQLSLKQLLDRQNNMCAGCGMKISKLYVRRMQYCNYYNKLFCQRCHQRAKMRIPARIIHQWNFREYPVSDIARRFLLDNYSQPAIDVIAVDPHFYDKFKNLRNVRMLRLQLVHLWSFIRLCSVAKSTFTMHGNLLSMFSCIPKHILEDADIYSMLDFEDVKNGNLTRLIEPLVRYGKCHVSSCEICQAKGFVCELCDQRNDLLFPFQLNKVSRCEECGSLSHIKCAARRKKQLLPCPKCVRIALNSVVQDIVNSWNLQIFKF